MKFLSNIFFILISVVIAIFFFFFIEENSLPTESIQSTWSEPEILFILPDSVDGNRFLSASVGNGETILLSNYTKRAPDLHALEFSYVILIKISENGIMSEEILSDVNYLAEGPALLHLSDNGKWHTLWGERREDPDFEKWETPIPRINFFSTSLIYRGGGIDETVNSVDIFSAGLLPDGGGAIRPPRFSIKIDESDNLHVVLHAWRFLEDAGGIMPFITYLQRRNDQTWEKARFPVVDDHGFSRGVEGVIETHDGDRLIIAFFGASPGEQQGSNDVLIVTSDDNGDTWSESKAIFSSGTQPAQFLRLYRDKQERLHLLWGRQIEGLPVPNEMWHSISEDGSNTWTDPKRFLVIEKPPGVSENGILDYDVVSDSFGCIHWVARTFEFRSSFGSGTSEVGAPNLYSRWCSSDKQWSDPETLGFIRDLFITAAVDDEEEKLYLFWADDVEDGNRKAIYYSIKSLKEPEPPRVISTSGPLQLHANYPNPFSSSTRLTFTLVESAEVEIKVYDMSGRQILHKNLGVRSVGTHTEDMNLSSFASGVYIYEIELNETWRQQSTMTYMK
ncbi:MAG: T9SS type A sorting domain-containing protein [Balneolaceae bacterium]